MRYLFLTLVLLVGCEKVIDNPITPPSDLSTEAKIVQVEFQKIDSEEDRLTIYKIFSGAADYLEHAKTLESSGQFDPVMGRVQSSYGWNREKYPKFTDAVEKLIIARGYDIPRKLDNEDDRQWLADIFEELAAATHE